VVPSRQVHDTFSNAIYGVDFDESFLTDYYYADLSEWDANHDGVYAEDGVDHPDYLPELGVTRIPVRTPAEAELYIDKVQHHLTAYELARLPTALFLSNVAVTVTVPFINVDVPVDSAIYFEMTGRTLSLVPPDYTVTKLYASLAVPGAQTLSVDAERQEIERSHDFIIHSGHGIETSLTSEADGNNDFTSDDAYALQNTQHPFFLSCACSAGNLAYPGSAGESLVTAPDGGAIGYLGNGATGLGLAGGAQLIDQFLAYAWTQDRPRVGDALKAAHTNMPHADSIDIPTGLSFYPTVSVPTVDEDSYEWTQKSALWLGDGLLPMWTDPATAPAPAVTVLRTLVGTFSRIEVAATPAVDGTVVLDTGANRYRRHTVNGKATFMLAEKPSRVWYGLESDGRLPALGDKTF
jgi:hypothetical protein